jgi:glycosyltransferase involved in cell wall biosynthesis
MKLYALVAVYNEARFIQTCLRHLIAQGCSVYLLDNDSTDETVALTRPFLGHGLLAIERLPRGDTFDLHAQMARKQALAHELDGDWYLHADADEIPLPSRAFATLAAGAAAADGAGYNVVNFEEFVFVPTREEPDHDHPRYVDTMRRYYFFAPNPQRLQRLWKRPAGRIDLDLGHGVTFPGKAIAPFSFVLKHYLALGDAHLWRKYGGRRWDAAHRTGPPTWRYRLDFSRVTFPPESRLCEWREDSAPDTSTPWATHWFETL